MFDPFNTEDLTLDSAIANAFDDLQKFDAADEGYQKTVDQLSKLYALRHETAQLNLQAQQSFAAHQLAEDQNAWQEEQDDRPFYERISPDTVVTVLGNLTVALLVIKYEQTGVIATKLTSFLRKI